MTFTKDSPLERLINVLIKPTTTNNEHSDDGAGSSDDEMYTGRPRPRPPSTTHGQHHAELGIFNKRGSMRRKRRSNMGKPSSKRGQVGLSVPLEEGGIGHSPVFRNRPHTDSVSSRGTSRRSSGASSLFANQRGHKRGLSHDTAATSVSSCAPMRGRQLAVPAQPKPIVVDLYPSAPPSLRDPWREDRLLKATGGSYVASLGLKPLPMPSSNVSRGPPLRPLQPEPEQPTIHITHTRELPPTPTTRDDTTIRSPTTPQTEVLHRRRSRSLSDIHARGVLPATAVPGWSSSGTSRPRQQRQGQPLKRGTIYFEPADATCGAFLAPRPKLIGRFDWEHPTGPPLVPAHRRDARGQMSSVEKRAAAKRAQARASKLYGSARTATDPRSRSQPLQTEAGWSAASGFAARGSPPIAHSFDWVGWNFRSPVAKPTRTRTMATQTPGDMMWNGHERQRSMSTAATSIGDLPEEERIRPRKRASSLTNLVAYESSVRSGRPGSRRSSRRSTEVALATPLPTLHSGYMFEGDYRPAGPSSSAPPPLERRRVVTPPERHVPPSLTIAPIRRPGSSRPTTGSRPNTGEAATQVDMRDSRSTGPLMLTPTLGGRPLDEFPRTERRPGSAPPSTSTRTSFSLESGRSEDVVDSENGDFPNLFFSPPLASQGSFFPGVAAADRVATPTSAYMHEGVVLRPGKRSDEHSSILDMDDSETEDEDEVTAHQGFITAVPSPAISTATLPPQTTAPLNIAPSLTSLAPPAVPTARPLADPQAHGWASSSYAASLFRDDGAGRLQTVRQAPVTVVHPAQRPSHGSLQAETVFESAREDTPGREGTLSAASSWLDFQQSPSVSPVAPYFLNRREPREEEDRQERVDRDSFLYTDDSPERDLRSQRDSFIDHDDSDSDIGTPGPSRMRFQLSPTRVPPPSLTTAATSTHLSTDSAGQMLSSHLSSGSQYLDVSPTRRGDMRDSSSNISVGSSLHDRLAGFPVPPSATRSSHRRQSSEPLGEGETTAQTNGARPLMVHRRSRSLPHIPSLSSDPSETRSPIQDFLEFESPDRSIDRTAYMHSRRPRTMSGPQLDT